jgi:hypothetical protein
MPAWIHDRAEHLLAKNPDMNKSTAFAVATQQSHALGKSPKGYGTAEGRRVAKAKFDTPGDDVKTAVSNEWIRDRLRQAIQGAGPGRATTGRLADFSNKMQGMVDRGRSTAATHAAEASRQADKFENNRRLGIAPVERRLGIPSKKPGITKAAGMRINYGLDFRPVAAHTHDEWLAGLFKRDGAFHVPDSLQHVEPLSKHGLAGFADELGEITKQGGVLGEVADVAKKALTTPIPGTPDLIAGKLQRVSQFMQAAKQPPAKGSFAAFQAARAAAGH